METRYSAAGRRGLRWYVNFTAWDPDEAELCRAFASIQVEERERIHQFRYEADAKASLAGRLLLRAAAVQLINQAAAGPSKLLNHAAVKQLRQTNGSVVLRRTGRGRPYLEGFTGVELNVSHAGDLTVLAAQLVEDDCKEHPGEDDSNGQLVKEDSKETLLLGVDVMPTVDRRLDRTDEFFRLMRRQFTETEWETILKGPSEESKLQAFYRHWSLKESYVKAVGTGLNMDLRSIDFRLNGDLREGTIRTDTEVYVGGRREDWVFEETLLQNHVVSVATSCKYRQQGQFWQEKKILDLLPEDQDLLGEINPEDWRLFSLKERNKPF